MNQHLLLIQRGYWPPSRESADNICAQVIKRQVNSPLEIGKYEG